MRQLSLLLLPLTVGLFTSCKKEEPIPSVELVKFETGGKTEIRAGETVTLSWELRNSTTVQIVATPPGSPLPDVSGDTGMVTTVPLFEATTFQLTATGADGSRVMSPAVRVEVRGIRIQSFTASPTSLDPGQSSTLEWTIGGDTPTEVVLKGPDGAELFSGDQATGSFEVSPIETSIYTLEVVAESGTDDAMVTVMVADVPPQIVSFTANPDPVAIGDLTQLRWETIGAAEVQVLKDGVVRRPWNPSGTSVSLEVDMPSVQFTLQARSATGMMTEQSITVMGLDIPIIGNVVITPVEYWEASTPATITWESEFTISTSLSVNGTAVPNFPGTPAGTFDFTVSGGTANVVLTAVNDVGMDTASYQVLAGFNEPEPNDTATTAIALDGDGVPVRGTIGPSDVDVFTVQVGAGQRIHATAGWNGTACSFDTMISLYAPDRVTRLGTVDDSAFPAVNLCSRINPALDEWADDLAAGTYYLHVQGSTLAAGPPEGTYSLAVEVSGPEVSLPGVTQTAVGAPSWQVTDVIQISLLVGNENNGFAQLGPSYDNLFLPLYGLEGFIGANANIHPIFRPVERNERDYDGVLSALVAINGYESKTTFTREEFETDNGILVLFVFEPGPGSPVESSYDFDSGPVLPTELFPMSMNWIVVKDAMTWWEDAPFELPGYHQYDPPVPGSGSSHRIFGVQIIDVLNPADAVGTYQQTFEVLDAGGAGWTITVPLTVTE
jgi:hypothetical protein